MRSLVIAMLFLSLFISPLEAAKKSKKKKSVKKPRFAAPIQVGSFIEDDQPFYHSPVDGRRMGAMGWPEDNLIPRGIVMHLDHQTYACFDPDLVRLAIVWQGEYIQLNGMAPISYDNMDAGKKSKVGQNALPAVKPLPISATGIYPGCHIGKPIFSDPRVPCPNPNEVGRGSLPFSLDKQQRGYLGLFHLDLAQWPKLKVLNPSKAGWVIKYEVSKTEIQEFYQADSQYFYRHLRIAPHNKTLAITLTDHHLLAEDEKPTFEIKGASLESNNRKHWLELKPSQSVQFITVKQSRDKKASSSKPLATKPVLEIAIPITKEKVVTPAKPLALERLNMPWQNNRRRNLRLSGIDFFQDGRAVLSTFDGDIWLVDKLADLAGGANKAKWRRIARGLSEPQSVAIRDEKIFVFHRGGIVELLSTTKGEYEQKNFCDLMAQTGETREFAMDMKLTNDGGFLVAKGGQQPQPGKHNGCVLKVSADGKEINLLAHGMREPYLGYDALRDAVYATDQQGHYVPSTPWRLVATKSSEWAKGQKASYHGFEQTRLKSEEQAFMPPINWIPHPDNPSSSGMLWPRKTHLDKGFFKDFLPIQAQGIQAGLHLDYNKSRLYLNYLDPSNPETAETTGEQRWMGSTMQLLLESVPFAPLKAAVNPVDGHVYIVGFQIWGSVAKELSGLSRLRYQQKAHQLPTTIRFTQAGAVIHFSSPIGQIPSMRARRWNYELTKNYGSPTFTLSGQNGQETMVIKATSLSSDRQKLFIAIDDMRLCDQLTLEMAFDDGSWPQNMKIATTIHELRSFEPAKAGFSSLAPFTKNMADPDANKKPTAAWGKALTAQYGCVACHSMALPGAAPVAPSWRKIYLSQRTLNSGKKVKADEAYLKRAILDPQKEVTKGFQPNMPSYNGVLSEKQIEAIILHIKSLK